MPEIDVKMVEALSELLAVLDAMEIEEDETDTRELCTICESVWCTEDNL